MDTEYDMIEFVRCSVFRVDGNFAISLSLHSINPGVQVYVVIYRQGFQERFYVRLCAVGKRTPLQGVPYRVQ